MSKLYRIDRTHVLYVKANTPEEAMEAVEDEMTVYEEYADSEPVEVDHIDTGIGFRILPDEEDEE